jgi:HEAT repeat protein
LSEPEPETEPEAYADPGGHQKASSDLVEATTLEESLTSHMVEQLAQTVLEEPILLEVKKPKAPEPLPLRVPVAPAPVPIQLHTEAWKVPHPSHAVQPPPPMVVPSPAPSPKGTPLEPTPRAVPREATGPDWSLAEAREALTRASRDREAIIEVAFSYAHRTFDFIAAFAVMRGAAVGWDARGEGADPAKIAQLSIPLDAASIFRTVAMTRGSYVGPLPPDALSATFLNLMGRSPRTVFLFPIEVKSRLVAILYGDSGGRPMSQRRLSDYLLFCQELPSAFQEVILFRKQNLGPGLSYASAPTLTEMPIPEPPPAPAQVPGLRTGWSASTTGSSIGFGRAASMPAMAVSQGETPPPDFAPVLRRLLGPDAALRARAMAELARTPEASAKVLAGSFPGPTAWSRLPVVELPEADELGPIPAALSRLGRAAAQALAPLLDSSDSDTRYLALLTAGNLGYGELVDGVLRGLFDLEPDISSAARAAATALKQLPRFDLAMRHLRQELAARDPLRRSLAARALGELHDRVAIDGLIGMTGSDDQMCAQAAAEALQAITRASFGTNPRAWTAWWADNRSRRRIEWLVAALRHPQVETREAAIEELSKSFNERLGYLAEGSPAEREAGVRRWETALAQMPGGQAEL